MSYSRRQLYAMGEPIGDSATYRKADGGLILGDGGGGGGGGQSPVQQQTQISDLPDWAKGYAQNVLAKGQALTATPYQAYGGERIAGFTPLQEQAFQGASQIGPTAQTAMGSGLAAAAGAGALGTGYQAGRFQGGTFTPGAAQAYMNPFVQASLAPQLELMQRQQGQQATQMAGQATQAGAFGGSRFGIQQAQQNLNNQLAQQNLIGQGYNTAYQQAQQQFNADAARRLQAQQLGEQSRQFGANLGLQGLQTGLQAAGTLGTLGQQQLAQQQAAIQAQSTAGAQQQAMQQKALDTAYQDYLTQLNYPYQQLSYMSNLIRGTPMGMNTQSQVYQPAPTAIQTAGSLGLGAYGLSKLFAAEGGLMKSYAGGGPVSFDKGGDVGTGLDVIDKFNDPNSLMSEMMGMTVAQLQEIIQHPATQAEAVAAQQALNAKQEAMMASERQGLAGAYNQLPYSTQEKMVRAAGGGILAFAGDEEENDPVGGQMIQSPGNPRLQGLYGDKMLEVIKRMESAPGYTPMTRDQTRAAELAEYQDLSRFAGEDPYAPMRKRLEEDEAARGKTLEQGKGLAALQAASAILQPGGTIRGLGAAGAAFGGAYGQALQADRAEKRYIGQMQFNLADAQRKERLGLTKEARASVQASEVAKLNAYKAGIQRDQAIGNMLGRGMQATRPIGGGGGGAKAPKGFDALADAEYKGLVAAGEKPGDETRRLAYRNAANIWGKQAGEERTAIGMGSIGAKLASQVETAQNKLRVRPEYLEASKDERKRMMDEVETRIYQNAGRPPTPADEQKTPEKGKKDYSNLWSNPS